MISHRAVQHYCGQVGIVGGDYSIKPFMEAVHWAEKKFYDNGSAPYFEGAL